MSTPTRLVIQNGSHANDGNGDTLRDAATKINNNFSALWGGVYGDSVPISVDDLSNLDFNGLTTVDPNVAGRLWRDSDNGNVLKVSRG
jgi:hypothetical protein